MIIHDVEQNTHQWMRARLGIPTASEFSELVKPNGGLTGNSCRSYAKRLVYEIITNEPLNRVTTKWMERGVDLEPEAVRMYEFLTDNKCEKIGFVTDDARTAGCSPDRFVIGKNRGLEIKCAAGWTHIDYLLDADFGDGYVQQTQGSMWITKWTSWDRMYYHPLLQPVIVPIKANPKYQGYIAAGVKRLHRLVIKYLGDLWQDGKIEIDNLSPEGLKLMAQIPGFKAPDMEGEMIWVE